MTGGAPRGLGRGPVVGQTCPQTVLTITIVTTATGHRPMVDTSTASLLLPLGLRVALSCAREVQHVDIQLGRLMTRLVDTPGISCTYTQFACFLSRFRD